MSNRQELMLAHVEKLAESGLTVRAYSEKTGIPYYRMEYWVRRKRELEVKKQEDSPFFIQLRDQQDQQSFHGFTPVGSPQVVLRFANGLCLEIYS